MIGETAAVLEVRKVHCATCGDVRNCQVEAKVLQKGGDEDFQWHTDWYILKCCGCDYIFVQSVSTNSEDYENFYEPDGSTGTSYTETIAFWPAISKRKPAPWLKEFTLSFRDDPLLDRTLEEIYGALNAGLPMLAAIGIRTAFDVAAVELGAEQDDTFAKKITKLVTIGKISEADKSRLSQLIEAGSASAHRGWEPASRELSSMMDILEHFIEFSIVSAKRNERLDLAAKALAAKVPQRK